MSHFKAKTHHWENGILRIVDNWFESFEQAIEFAGTSGAHSVKVFAKDGSLLHSGTVAQNSYA